MAKPSPSSSTPSQNTASTHSSKPSRKTQPRRRNPRDGPVTAQELWVSRHSAEFGGLVRRMLDEEPGKRPEIAEVMASFGDAGLFLACRCPPAPEGFVA